VCVSKSKRWTRNNLCSHVAQVFSVTCKETCFQRRFLFIFPFSLEEICFSLPSPALACGARFFSKVWEMRFAHFPHLRKTFGVAKSRQSRLQMGKTGANLAHSL